MEEEFLGDIGAITPQEIQYTESKPTSSLSSTQNPSLPRGEKQSLSPTDVFKKMRDSDVFTAELYKVPEPEETRTSFRTSGDRYDGFSLTKAIVENPLAAEQLGADSQSTWLTGYNDLVVGATNFAAMFGTSFTGIYDMLKERSLTPGEGALTTAIGKWRNEVDKDHINFQSQRQSDSPLLSMLTTTNGLGELFKSTMFGIGAAAGLAVQAAAVTFATEGIGTIPTIANGVRNILQSSRALGALAETVNLSKNALMAAKAADITRRSVSLAKGLAAHYIGAYGEAEFEALESKENLVSNFTKQYYDKYNQLPTEDEIAKINDLGEQAKKARFALNAGMLMLTNYAMINSVTKPFRKIVNGQEKLVAKGFVSKLGKEGIKITEDIPAKLKPNTSFRNKIINAKGSVFNAVKNNASSITLSEGFEEGYQYLVGKSTDNYFTNRYNEKAKAGAESNIFSILEQMYKDKKELATTEGLKSIISGIVSGTGQSLLAKGYEKIRTSGQRLATKEAYKNNIPEEEESLNNLLKSAVNVRSITGTTASEKADILATTTQINNLQNTTNSEITNEFLKNQALFVNNYHGVKLGQVDILNEIIKRQLESASLDEFNELLGYTGIHALNEEGRSNVISEIKENLNNVKKAIETTDSAFVNPYKYGSEKFNKYEVIKESAAYHSFMASQMMKLTDKKIANSSILAKDNFVAELLDGSVESILKERKILESQYKSFTQLGEGQTLDPASKEVVKGILDKLNKIDDVLSAVENEEKIEDVISKIGLFKGLVSSSQDLSDAFDLKLLKLTHEKHVNSFRDLSNPRDIDEVYKKYISAGEKDRKEKEDFENKAEEELINQEIAEVAQDDPKAIEIIQQEVKETNAPVKKINVTPTKPTPVTREVLNVLDKNSSFDTLKKGSLISVNGIKLRVLNKNKKTLSISTEKHPLIKVYSLTEQENIKLEPKYLEKIKELVDRLETIKEVGPKTDLEKAILDYANGIDEIENFVATEEDPENLDPFDYEVDLVNAITTEFLKEDSSMAGLTETNPVVEEAVQQATPKEKPILPSITAVAVPDLAEEPVFEQSQPVVKSEDKNESKFVETMTESYFDFLRQNSDYSKELIDRLDELKTDWIYEDYDKLSSKDIYKLIKDYPKEFLEKVIKEHPGKFPEWLARGVDYVPEQKTISNQQQVVLDKFQFFKNQSRQAKIILSTGTTEGGYEINGKLFRRVSNAIGNTISFSNADAVTNITNGIVVGNYVDNVARQFFNKGSLSSEEFTYSIDLETSQNFKQLVTALESTYKKLKVKHGQNSIFVTEELLLAKFLPNYGPFEGIAGTPDMLVIDEDGSIHIYDFKNRKSDRGTVTETSLSSGGEVKKWSKQQSMYASLIEDLVGIKPKSVNAIVIPTSYEVDNFKGNYEVEEEINNFSPVPKKLKFPSNSFDISLNYLSNVEILAIEEDKPKEVESKPVVVNPDQKTLFEPILNKEIFTYEEGNPVLGFLKETTDTHREFLEGFNNGTITLDQLELVDIAPDTKSKSRPMPFMPGIVLDPAARNNYKGLMYKGIMVYSFRNPEVLKVSNVLIKKLSEDIQKSLKDEPSLYEVLKAVENKPIDKQIFLDNVSLAPSNELTFQHAIPYYDAYNAWINAGAQKETIQDYFDLSFTAYGFPDYSDVKIPLTQAHHSVIEFNGQKIKNATRFLGVWYEVKNNKLEKIIDEDAINFLIENSLETEVPEDFNISLIVAKEMQGGMYLKPQFLKNPRKTPEPYIKEIFDLLNSIFTESKNRGEVVKALKAGFTYLSDTKNKVAEKAVSKNEKIPLPNFFIENNSKEGGINILISYGAENNNKNFVEKVKVFPDKIEFFTIDNNVETAVEGGFYKKKVSFIPDINNLFIDDRKMQNYFPMTFGKTNFKESIKEPEPIIEEEFEEPVVNSIDYTITFNNETFILDEQKLAKYIGEDQVEIFINLSSHQQNAYLEELKEFHKNLDIKKENNGYDLPSQRKDVTLGETVQKLIKHCNK